MRELRAVLKKGRKFLHLSPWNAFYGNVWKSTDSCSLIVVDAIPRGVGAHLDCSERVLDADLQLDLWKNVLIDLDDWHLKPGSLMLRLGRNQDLFQATTCACHTNYWWLSKFNTTFMLTQARIKKWKKWHYLCPISSVQVCVIPSLFRRVDAQVVLTGSNNISGEQPTNGIGQRNRGDASGITILCFCWVN